ncbi:unnamed protein product [Rodentolepis nana]|uniref:4.1m domain-containing protein n=1 Tax=Rodentolepis nana TaxID=102285 RepID=A0A0R3TP15_RODNA|nr:unnamed protein product [Rodentolepis nana]
MDLKFAESKAEVPTNLNSLKFSTQVGLYTLNGEFAFPKTTFIIHPLEFRTDISKAGPDISVHTKSYFIVAVLKILLVVHQATTSAFTDIYHSRKYPVQLSSSSSSSSPPYKTNDSYWESRITKALHDLCQASMGYQRVASIRRLPTANSVHQRIRATPFEVTLYSTGHLRTLSSLEELIKHRLDEGYLPGLGSLDPEASCVKRLEGSMPGKPKISYQSINPEPDFSQDLDIGSGNIEVALNIPIYNLTFRHADVVKNLGRPHLCLISGEESIRDPPQQDYPGSNRRRPISVRQTAHDLAIQNSWRHREILNQPGVIAAIVGSTIAGLLLLILLILFCVYRLRKKDEGSYSLEEPQKGATTSGAYVRAPSREFYA